jgi:hypothetical protein
MLILIPCYRTENSSNDLVVFSLFWVRKYSQRQFTQKELIEGLFSDIKGYKYQVLMFVTHMFVTSEM